LGGCLLYKKNLFLFIFLYLLEAQWVVGYKSWQVLWRYASGEFVFFVALYPFCWLARKSSINFQG